MHVLNNRSRRGNTANYLASTIRERSIKEGSLPRIMESTLSPPPCNRRANLLSRQNIKCISTNPTMNKLHPAPLVKQQNFLNVKSLENLQESQKPFMENKNYANLRLKCGVQKPGGRHKSPDQNEVESLPSQLDENQWAEIHNYDFHLYQQQQKQMRQDLKDKKNLVKKTLDHQIQEQKQTKQQTLDYNQQMDRMILRNARREIEIEKKHRYEQKKKVELQKVQRDVMLFEA